MSSADLIQQLSGRALGRAHSSRGSLENLRQLWIKSSKLNFTKVAFFLFFKMFVSQRHRRMRLSEIYFSPSLPSSVRGRDSVCLWQTLEFEVIKGEMKTHQTWKDYFYLFILWSRNVAEFRCTKFAISILYFFLSWLYCFFLLIHFEIFWKQYRTNNFNKLPYYFRLLFQFWQLLNAMMRGLSRR